MPTIDEVVLPFYDRLEKSGLTPAMCRTFELRRQHSIARVNELSRRLKILPSIMSYPALGIYAAGSHARGDASKYSDIDLWFVHDDTKLPGKILDPNIRAIKVMSAVIQQMEGMEFPEPSNDGEYLKILPVSEVLKHLGGPQDDYKNHFTARMLLMLESSPVYGESVYHSAIDEIISAYMRDYQDHAANFRPTFLVNDILRYWKTLCLNYENRRNKQEDARKIKHKIRNFKLGYSRLLTCFATVAILSNYNNVDKDGIIKICKMTPIERLLCLSENQPNVKDLVLKSLISYHWFLEKTAIDPDQIEIFFSSRDNRVIAFQSAKEFGDQIYQVVKTVAENAGTLRYLVV